jgi:polysaccharide biosynthesis protein PelF
MTRVAEAQLATQTGETDVCILVEGCYPFVPGGVSSWIDWLMKTQPELTFSVVSLWPRPDGHAPRYKLPPNATGGLHQLYLQDFGARPSRTRGDPDEIAALGQALTHLLVRGGIDALHDASQRLTALRARGISPAQLFNSPAGWQIAREMYEGQMPYGSFLHFFWAWRALLGGVLATLEFPLPKARVYHTISTGYSGVLAARAGLETGRPVLLTEHGIYTNERRIELLMAEWVTDTIDKGHALADPRLDLRDMWIAAFESYARTCYEGSTQVITLYEDNQRVQRVLGAEPGRLRVIANGIDLKRFAGLSQAPSGAVPTIAMIGRVVPIKDVKTFITAVKILSGRVKTVRALIMGPVDEDAGYVAECRQLVADLDVGHIVEFTGNVDIVAYMPQIHVVALTSLSESQPLTLLEAGAASIPFVATNVGSCREILEGRSDEAPHLGAGGIVTNVVAPGEIARALQTLLENHDQRRAMGAALKSRVEKFYRSEQASAAYTELYGRMIAAPAV